MPETLGLDIGGANIKAATSAGQAYTLPFPLWKKTDQLCGALHEVLVRLEYPQQSEGLIAITMTGELCDCFPSKAAGVRHILLAVQDVFREQPVFVWRNDGKWASINHSLEEPAPVASANWLASATFAARYLPSGEGYFFDLGSTTLDVIRIAEGRPFTKSHTDLDRLQAGELHYIGCSRTPVCHLLQHHEMRGKPVSLAAEMFATIDDARLVLNQSEEDEADRNTADGQPRTRRHAAARLARMLCSDIDELGSDRVDGLAAAVMQAFQQRLKSVAATTLRSSVVITGSGEEYLLDVLRQQEPISISKQLGSSLSTALAAYAVATLLAERQSR
jgi:(4-(4-[2-(gamma-L-glutamylamino)ethyl]phenoxymethyl)furan-2-yl)methanamine synthase